MTATVARGLPDGVHLSLPGAWHGPDDTHLAAALIEFFTTAEVGAGDA